MLTDDELESARAVQRLLNNKQATILRSTTTPDGAGGHRTSYAVLRTVTCRMSAAGGRDADLLAGRLSNGQSAWRITVPAQTDVTAADRVAVDGRTFEVLQVLEHTNETARVLLCMERGL